MTPRFNRRSLLRGMVHGTAVGIALPLLDCFLDGNGTALADGAKLPTRFGTYFWGLGLTPGRWVPKQVGPNWEVSPELAALEPLRSKVNVFSGFRILLDGKPNLVHWTGQASILTGQAPAKTKSFDRMPSFDTLISDAIGGATRFRSIDVTPFGNPSICYSTRGEDNFKPADATPVGLYTRIFGDGFQDPNSGEWKPDPGIMLQQSVLSAVKDQRDTLMREAGSSDRRRLEQYFTSVRETEQQLQVQLQRPAPAEACVVPKNPGERKTNGEVRTVTENNRLMSELLAMALACNQTKVFNMAFTSATSELYLPGDSTIYHQHTHEELVDDKLGYQPVSSELAKASVNGFADFLKVLDSVKEGDGTLLDHSLVMGFSDTGYAKIHSTDSIPMLFAGSANGRLKTGQHIAVGGDPVTRVALTAQQAMGLPAGGWGSGSMQTGKAITEVLA